MQLIIQTKMTDRWYSLQITWLAGVQHKYKTKETKFPNQGRWLVRNFSSVIIAVACPAARLITFVSFYQKHLHVRPNLFAKNYFIIHFQKLVVQ